VNRRALLKGMLAGIVMLTPIGRAFTKELISQNGALKTPNNIHKVYAAGPPAAVFLYTLVPEKLISWPSAMSAEARAEQLAIYSKRLLKRAADFALAHRANGQRPARIYTTRSNDGLETGLAGSIHSEVIELLGCHNVASPPYSKHYWA